LTESHEDSSYSSIAITQQQKYPGPSDNNVALKNFVMHTNLCLLSNTMQASMEPK